jgi:hypothetical protein
MMTATLCTCKQAIGTQQLQQQQQQQQQQQKQQQHSKCKQRVNAARDAHTEQQHDSV